MHRIAIALIGVVLSSAACALPRPLHSQATLTCLGAASDSGFLQSILVSMVTGTDPTSVSVRQGLQLPQLAASAVTYVTDRRTCGSAASALDATQGEVVAGRRMYVFKLGNTRYAVYEEDGSAPPAGTAALGRSPMWFFDSKWKYLSTGAL